MKEISVNCKIYINEYGKWLENDDRIEWVNYPGLSDSPYYGLVQNRKCSALYRQIEKGNCQNSVGRRDFRASRG